MEFYWSVMDWAGMNCSRGSWYGVLLISDELGRDELLKRVMVWSSIDQWWAGQGWTAQEGHGMAFYWSVMSWAGMNCSRGSWYGVLLISDELGWDELLKRVMVEFYISCLWGWLPFSETVHCVNSLPGEATHTSETIHCVAPHPVKPYNYWCS